MNSDKYQANLMMHLLPTLHERFPNGDGIFQQDNAHATSQRKKMQCFFGAEKMTVLEWPGNSSELNPIENLRAIIKGRTMARTAP